LDVSAEELQASVGAVAEGLLAGSPEMIEPLLSRFQPADAEEDAPLEPLTERETQVLQLIAQGLANKQIAAALAISEHTVKFHVSTVFSKLGVNSRTEAVRLGVQKGLVSL
jgi:DNA-binding NarL/FixJ family response regulator